LRRAKKLIIYADGAIRSNPEATGLALIIKDERGRILEWPTKVIGKLTCNEAEYEALIFALERARKYRPCEVYIYLDSQVVVNQVKGIFGVRSPALRELHVKARLLMREFPKATITYIPRWRNRLADALANEAVDRKKREG
jgi:ribonuclease HI